MKFLTNIHNPSDKNAKLYISLRPHETLKEAVTNHLEWLKGKVIGEPQATEAYTVAQLKEIGMVGVYMPNNSVHADAVDSAASTSISEASALSTSQTDQTPQQRG